MDKKLFGELIASIREMGKIGCGEAKPGRVHVYPAERVRRLRKISTRVKTKAIHP